MAGGVKEEIAFHSSSRLFVLLFLDFFLKQPTFDLSLSFLLCHSFIELKYGQIERSSVAPPHPRYPFVHC